MKKGDKMAKTVRNRANAGEHSVVFRCAPDGRALSLHRKGHAEFGWRGLSGSVEVNGRLLKLANAKAVRLPASRAGEQEMRFDFPAAGCRWRWELKVSGKALEVKTAWDTYLLAAVFNLDDRPYECGLDFAQLGVDPAAAHRVFEFWNGEYVGTFRRRLACSIPAGACRLYRIARARPYPWLLGTDLHVQQGAVEVKALAWDASRMRLSGTVTRPAGESGNLFLLMPRNMRLINHEATGLLKELLDFTVIVRVPVTCKRDSADFEFFFERHDLTPPAPRGLINYSTEK